MGSNHLDQFPTKLALNGVLVSFLLLISLVWADSSPKFVRQGANYVRIPYGSLQNPCDGKLPVREGKVLLFDAMQSDFAVIGKALEGTFLLWREYPCRDKKVHGMAKEYRGGKVVEAVPYKSGVVEGKKLVYYPSGNLKEVLNFEDGEREGEYKKFDSRGRLMVVANYDDNKLDGKVRYYDMVRGVITIFEYDDGAVEGDPTYETENVQEALLLAARNGHGSQVKQLLKKGVNDKKAKVDGYGETEVSDNTALIEAIRAGKKEVVELLLEQGANPNRATRDGKLSPLMAAVVSEQLAAAKAVLEKGPDLNWQNGDGDSALHLAVRLGRLPFVQAFVDKGASVTVRNKKGQTPASLTQAPEISAILQSASPAEEGE